MGAVGGSEKLQMRPYKINQHYNQPTENQSTLTTYLNGNTNSKLAIYHLWPESRGPSPCHVERASSVMRN